jgi:glycosyltransferase involved in cell wall biosynthesis
MYSYSVCFTTYNTADTIGIFLTSILTLPEEFEIIMVDNFSKDDTVQIARQMGNGRILIHQETCKIGRGRQIAINISSGETIIQVDADVIYHALPELVKTFERDYGDKIVKMSYADKNGNGNFTIGKRELFKKVGGYANLNFLEDVHLYKRCESIGTFTEVRLKPGMTEPIARTIKHSQIESRFEKNYLRLLRRKILNIRDIIYVENLSFLEFVKWYNHKGLKILAVGLPEYVIGRILFLTLDL